MTTQLGLNCCAYSKHCFCKIYVSVILQLSGMKLAIHNHSTEKNFLLNFFERQSITLQDQSGEKCYFFRKPSHLLKEVVTTLNFKNYLIQKAMILHPHSLRYSSSLFTVLFFKCKCLRIISCERQLLHASNKKRNIHKIIFLSAEKVSHLNKSNFKFCH